VEAESSAAMRASVRPSDIGDAGGVGSGASETIAGCEDGSNFGIVWDETRRQSGGPMVCGWQTAWKNAAQVGQALVVARRTIRPG
jgi:hypothetical protein